MQTQPKDRVERRRVFIIHVLYWAVIAAILFFVYKYLLGILMPLVIGFIVAFCLNPLIKRVMKLTKMPRGITATIIVVACYVVLGTLLALLSIWLFGIISDFVVHLPEYYDDFIMPTLQRIEAAIVQNVGVLVPEWNQEGTGYSLLGELTNFILSFSSSGLTFLTNLTTSLPMILISCIITILSSLLMSIYYYDLTRFVLRQLPERAQSLVLDVRKLVTTTIFHYVVAYIKIMGITFVELAIGLSILQVPMSVLIAFGIAFFDLLPILGTGGILVPWIIWSIINQNYVFALGMTILYIVVLVVRNFIEPKIVGDQLGLNPLVSMACIYVGLVTMGLSGVLLLPVTVQIIVTLHRQGKLDFIKL